MVSKNRYILLIVIAGLVLILDQLTKLYIVSSFSLYESVTVFKNFFHITYIRNPGAAFGIFAGSAVSFRIPFFLTLSFVAIVGMLFFYKTVTEKLLRIAISLILGWAVGNMIDRARFGEVIDFIDVHWYDHHWPAFNVADSAITIGVGLLILDMVLKEKKKKEI
ncbi:MAG: lipoprotein signal peptidase [Deltaproteobacteria bacterium]|nr:lipoprotein signal peptidase [Deltaproteobacteria bacterium]